MSSLSNQILSFDLGCGKKKQHISNISSNNNDNNVINSVFRSITSDDNPSSAKKPLNSTSIVPLIKKNVWRNTKNTTTHTLVEDEAVAALIAEATNFDNDDADDDHHRTKVPLLVANMPPGLNAIDDEDKKFQYDVSLRPDEPDLDAYSRVPIGSIGRGMLEGMGWKKGDPIGLTNKAVITPGQFVARVGREGLGAEVYALPSNKRKRILKPGESREKRAVMRVAPDANGKVKHYRSLDDQLVPIHTTQFEKGKLVKIVGGEHRGLYGRITSFDKRVCCVKLNLNETSVELDREHVIVQDEHALPKDHPAFRTSDRSRASSKRKSGDPAHADTKRVDKRAKKLRPVRWARSHIRVRIVSRSLRNGAYYTKKGVIVDVVDAYHFTVLMPDGVILEHVTERDVETALPRSGGMVMVVRGSVGRPGEKGKLLERNSSKNLAVVQLDDDLTIVECTMDDVAEWVV